MIEEDFDSLKRVFCTSAEGLINEDVVDQEAETVEAVIALMGQFTEQLASVEDFNIITCYGYCSNTTNATNNQKVE